MVAFHRARRFVQEFSLPLLVGVVVAMLTANLAPEWYEHALEWAPFGHLSVLGHHVTLHFLVNDVFMVFFFGIAAKEIAESAEPGGSLNPIKKAVNPLLATLGGVTGPILVFFVGLFAMQSAGLVPADAGLARGWGIPTATDIALAWLVARAVFGKGHPAIDFLLLLAVADDAIGLVIIALFYGDPAHPADPVWLGLVVAAMVYAFALRRMGVRSWLAYVGVGGPMAWVGLVMAHLHPALALVFVVPFMAGDGHDEGLFVDDGVIDSPLEAFEHIVKLPVDFGLFAFAFANAGVAVSGVGPLTWLVIGALVIGKTVGVTTMSLAARAMGFPLPTGMTTRDLFMAGYVAALGLTVALFVAGAAFTDPALAGEAKMGALLSGVVGASAVLLGRVLGFGRATPPVGATDGASTAAAK